jgi:hypothetical protein
VDSSFFAFRQPVCPAAGRRVIVGESPTGGTLTAMGRQVAGDLGEPSAAAAVFVAGALLTVRNWRVCALTAYALIHGACIAVVALTIAGALLTSRNWRVCACMGSQVALVKGACIAVVALTVAGALLTVRNWRVCACMGSQIALVKGACIAIVALTVAGAAAFYRHVYATLHRITAVGRTGIGVVTGFRSVGARSGSRITGVDSAAIAIVAFWLVDAFACCNIAGSDCTEIAVFTISVGRTSAHQRC